MPRLRAVGLLLLSSAVPRSLPAQGRVIELGQDLGFALTFNGSTVRSLTVPNATVRVGVFVSPVIAVEPEIGLNHLNVEDSGSITTLSLLVSLPVHLRRNRDLVRPYVRPLAGITALDIDGGANQFQAGVGLGLKAPLAERLAARLEGVLIRAFESETLPGATQIGIRLGFSFFTS